MVIDSADESSIDNNQLNEIQLILNGMEKLLRSFIVIALSHNILWTGLITTSTTSLLMFSDENDFCWWTRLASNLKVFFKVTLSTKNHHILAKIKDLNVTLH